MQKVGRKSGGEKGPRSRVKEGGYGREGEEEYCPGTIPSPLADLDWTRKRPPQYVLGEKVERASHLSHSDLSPLKFLLQARKAPFPGAMRRGKVSSIKR